MASASQVVTSRSFPAVASSVRAARQWVRTVVVEAGHNRVVDTVALLVSELASNVVTHTAEADFLVQVEADDHLYVAVCDANGTLPHVHRVAPDALSGRGLALVEAFADEWGVVPRGDGKCLWFRLRSPLATA